MKTINKTVDISSMAREELEENYIKMSTQLESANQKISWLEEQFRLNRAKKFGPSSEQSKVDFEQLTIFNEAEFILSSEEVPVEPKMVDVAPPVKRKKKGHKEKLVQSLPKEVIEYKLTSEEMDCPTCGEPLKEMKKVIRKELCVIPAKVYVKEHVQYLYACRECQKTGDGNPISSAPSPLPLFRNSLASPSLLAYVIKRKYASAMPLYRQEQEFHRNGIKLSRQTLANWVIGSTEQYLHGLYTLMREKLLSLDIIHADETRLEVLHEPGREATDSSFMWLYSSGKYDKPIVIYQYSESRAGEIPKKFLEGFSGYLQSDGYAGYHALLKKEDGSKSGITPIGCWAHCRRKFTDAHKALSKEAQADPNTNIAKGLDYCNRIFRIESQLAAVNPVERQVVREKEVEPLLEEYFTWVKALEGAVVKSKLKDAITYSINQEIPLRNFMLDGRLECSNNRAERGIKPFVIGRKNFLFCNTPRGAEASAVIYSLMETAKGNGLDPFRYFEYLLETLSQQPKVSKELFQNLLPWSDKLPETCKAILDSGEKAAAESVSNELS